MERGRQIRYVNANGLVEHGFIMDSGSIDGRAAFKCYFWNRCSWGDLLEPMTGMPRKPARTIFDGYFQFVDSGPQETVDQIIEVILEERRAEVKKHIKTLVEMYRYAEWFRIKSELQNYAIEL